VREFLEPSHFYEPVHGRIYEAILRLIDRDHTASPPGGRFASFQ
ncbi:MAG: hypothetical protein D6800_09595, partial [Candidatus Zixiibacteriota bacterium]